MLISSYKSSLYSRLFIIAENKAIRNHFFTVLDSAANHNLHPAAIFRLSLYIITERTVISIHWQCYIKDTAIQFSVYKILLLHIGYGKRKCKLLPRAHNPQIEQKTQNKKKRVSKIFGGLNFRGQFRGLNFEGHFRGINPKRNRWHSSVSFSIMFYWLCFCEGGNHGSFLSI